MLETHDFLIGDLVGELLLACRYSFVFGWEAIGEIRQRHFHDEDIAVVDVEERVSIVEAGDPLNLASSDLAVAGVVYNHLLTLVDQRYEKKGLEQNILAS